MFLRFLTDMYWLLLIYPLRDRRHPLTFTTRLPVFWPFRGRRGHTGFYYFFSPWRKLEDRFDVEIKDLPVLVPTQKKPFIRTILKNSYKVLPIISKSFILNVTGFLDLPLMIERIYLTLCCDLCCSIVKEMVL